MSELKDRVVGALRNLDPKNDQHWTTAGLPRMDVLEQALGLQPQELKRADVTSAAPNFTRATLDLVSPERADTSPPAPVNGPGEGEGAAATQASLAQAVPEPSIQPIVGADPKPAPTPEIGEGIQNWDPDSREAALAKLDALGVELAELKLVEQAARKAVRDHQDLVDKARAATDRKFPPMSEAEAIQRHVASQQAQRAARYSRAREVTALLGPAPHVAPIDAAMQRKHGYGHQRPAPQPLVPMGNKGS